MMSTRHQLPREKILVLQFPRIAQNGVSRDSAYRSPTINEMQNPIPSYPSPTTSGMEILPSVASESQLQNVIHRLPASPDRHRVALSSEYLRLHSVPSDKSVRDPRYRFSMLRSSVVLRSDYGDIEYAQPSRCI